MFCKRVRPEKKIKLSMISYWPPYTKLVGFEMEKKHVCWPVLSIMVPLAVGFGGIFFGNG